MCMSAITWAGFDNYLLFQPREDSRDAFAIPHDLKILKNSLTWSLEAIAAECILVGHNLIHIAALFDDADRDAAAAQSAYSHRYDALSAIPRYKSWERHSA